MEGPPPRLSKCCIESLTALLFGFDVSRFEADDNAILDCPLTCFDGSEDLHNQDGKLVITILVTEWCR